jgi:hypothetical protein
MRQHSAETIAMSEDVQTSNTDAPITRALLESLSADYLAGRLPNDVKERIDALRDEFFGNLEARGGALQGDLKPGIEEFVRELNAQMTEYEASGGTLTSEVADSRIVPVVANGVDGLTDTVIEPVIDAVDDIVHDVYGYASDLLQIRAEHDPEGLYAPKLDAAQAELDRAGDVFDAEIEAVHVRIDAVHDEMEELRADAEEFHQHHAPVQIIRSTTVDPNLQEQMAEETGEGSA